MPKENTHMFFAYELLEAFQEQEILRDISNYVNFYLFGSISPDIFFYSGTKELRAVSETLHGKTGKPTNIPILAMLEEAVRPEDLAFILGYITHCALDITFHPVIYYLSGNYYDNDPEKKAHAVYLHRHLETCLDLDLPNPFRLHAMIRTSQLKGLVYEKVICRDFAVTPRQVRQVLGKQILSNFLFTSRAAYLVFMILSRVGLTKDTAMSGLFYADTARGNRLPSLLSVKDIITGEERTTTVKELFAQANRTAIPMMTAAYGYLKKSISREELVQAIPGLSLDTGKLMVTPESIRYTV
jgi:hypothetical protein